MYLTIETKKNNCKGHPLQKWKVSHYCKDVNMFCFSTLFIIDIKDKLFLDKWKLKLIQNHYIDRFQYQIPFNVQVCLCQISFLNIMLARAGLTVFGQVREGAKHFQPSSTIACVKPHTPKWFLHRGSGIQKSTSLSLLAHY